MTYRKAAHLLHTPESPACAFARETSLVCSTDTCPGSVIISRGLSSHRMKQGDSDLWYRDYWKRLRQREKVIQELRAPRIHWFHSNALNEVEQKIFEATRDRRR